MLNQVEAFEFFRHLTGFTDYGMDIEWPIFVKTIGDKIQYSKTEIKAYCGY